MPLAVIRSFTGICFCPASARAFSRASGVPLPVADLNLLRCLASRNAEKLSALDRSIQPLHNSSYSIKQFSCAPNFKVIPRDFRVEFYFSSVNVDLDVDSVMVV